MNAAPCGCRERERARDYDPGSFEYQEAEMLGKDHQERWRCPRAGYTPANTARELGPDCAEALEGLRRLCDFKGATTCPEHYMQLPWTVRGSRAQHYRDKGQLALIEPTPIAAAMQNAINALYEHRALRARNDYERQRKEHETHIAAIKARGDTQ